MALVAVGRIGRQVFSEEVVEAVQVTGDRKWSTVVSMAAESAFRARIVRWGWEQTCELPRCECSVSTHEMLSAYSPHKLCPNIGKWLRGQRSVNYSC